MAVRVATGQVVDATLGDTADLSVEDARDGEGYRIDDAYTAAVVERVRGSAEYRRWRGWPVDDPNESTPVTLRLSPRLARLAQAEADARGVTLSRLCRDALEDYLRP